jgi:hypothetical protein
MLIVLSELLSRRGYGCSAHSTSAESLHSVLSLLYCVADCGRPLFLALRTDLSSQPANMGRSYICASVVLALLLSFAGATPMSPNMHVLVRQKEGDLTLPSPELESVDALESPETLERSTPVPTSPASGGEVMYAFLDPALQHEVPVDAKASYFDEYDSSGHLNSLSFT